MVTHSSAPALTRPKQFLLQLMRDLVASRELATRLFLRDFRAKYRQSFLGYFWLIFPPLALTGSFVLMQRSNLLTAGTSSDVPYALFALAGMLFWQCFSDAITVPIRLVGQSKSMLVKLNFPREALVLAAMLEVSFTFLVRLAIFLIFGLCMGLTFSATTLLLPLVFMGLLIVGTGLGVVLTPGSLLFSDFSQGLPLLMSFALICTPVAYVAQPGTLLGTINSWNPIAPIIGLGRDILLNAPITSGQLLVPLIVAIAGLLTLFFGWIFYRLSIPHIIARIGS
jgi:lipopolysaccharide transport system permease protein